MGAPNGSGNVGRKDRKKTTKLEMGTRMERTEASLRDRSQSAADANLAIRVKSTGKHCSLSSSHPKTLAALVISLACIHSQVLQAMPREFCHLEESDDPERRRPASTQQRLPSLVAECASSGELWREARQTMMASPSDFC